jgi:hypothetical protein
MAAYLDPLEWRLEQLRGQGCVTLAETQRLVAESRALIEQLRASHIEGVEPPTIDTP